MIGILISGAIMVLAGIALVLYVRRAVTSELSPREEAVGGLSLIVDGGWLDSDEALRVKCRLAECRK